MELFLIALDTKYYASNTSIPDEHDHAINDISGERLNNNLMAVHEEFREWLDDMANYDVDEEAAQSAKKVRETTTFICLKFLKHRKHFMYTTMENMY